MALSVSCLVTPSHRRPRSCGPGRHPDPPEVIMSLARAPPSSFAQVVSRERPEQSRVVPEDGVRPRTSLCVDGARDRTGPPLPLVQRSPLAEGYDWWGDQVRLLELRSSLLPTLLLTIRSPPP